MREYLFRGQTRKKGEKVWMDGSPVDGNWVYGGVNQGKGDFSIIYQTEPEINKLPVYTDTLGQYTGMDDKNRERIFEGDIVRYDPERMEEPSDQYMVVEYREDKFVMRVIGTEIYGTFDGVPHEYEVIGNIHDNPELVGNTDILEDSEE